MITNFPIKSIGRSIPRSKKFPLCAKRAQKFQNGNPTYKESLEPVLNVFIRCSALVLQIANCLMFQRAVGRCRSSVSSPSSTLHNEPRNNLRNRHMRMRSRRKFTVLGPFPYGRRNNAFLPHLYPGASLVTVLVPGYPCTPFHVFLSSAGRSSAISSISL